MLEIEILNKKNDGLWDSYVNNNPRSSVYHLSVWKDLVKNVFGHDSYYLHAISDGEVVGILPLIRITSYLFGDFIISMPFFNYGGVIGNTHEIEDELMKYACCMAKDIGVHHVEYRDVIERNNLWEVRKDKVVMELQLPDSSDELWKMFKPKLRAQIRKPIKEGAIAVHGGKELLDEFYQVFSRNMRDLGTPVYSKEFFSEILSALPESSMLTIIRYNDKPVAAGFLIGYQGCLEIPWASSVREYNSIGVNMLLYWNVLEQAIKGGYKTFDFGRSSLNSGTYRFKKQWGAQPKQLFWHYCISDGGSIPEITPNNPKYRLAISVWQRLPLFIANYLGPNIVKYLP